MPDNKRNHIYQIVCELLKARSIKIRRLAEIIGTLVSACLGVNYGCLYIKNLEREKFLALKTNNGDYDANTTLQDNSRVDLNWWKQNIFTINKPIRKNKYIKTIFTDASTTGWGAFCENKRANGWWSISEKEKHINYLELLAALNGLKSFANNLSNGEILLRIDNTTAITYINKMGGIQYPHLNEVSRKIWQWCESKNLYIFASHINTKENTEPDTESRKLPPETEWELSKSAFQKIVQTLGEPEIDLFASDINKKCKSFISWKQDPDAEAVDAFTISWKNLCFYAFHPFSVILRVLNKIILDKAEG